MSARIGPQMAHLASRVIDGDTICALVDRAYRTRRGFKSRSFGYRVVHRAIEAGLIQYTYEGGRYTLYKPTIAQEDAAGRLR